MVTYIEVLTVLKQSVTRSSGVTASKYIMLVISEPNLKVVQLIICEKDIVSGKCKYITQYFLVIYIEVLTALKQSATRSSGDYCKYIHNVGYLWAKSQGGALIIWEDIVSGQCKYITQFFG